MNKEENHEENLNEQIQKNIENNDKENLEENKVDEIIESSYDVSDEIDTCEKSKKDLEEPTNKSEQEQEYDELSGKQLYTPAELNKKRNKNLIIIISIIVVSILIFFGSIVCINKLNANVYRNVYVLGINMSGMTKEEVYETLLNISQEQNDNENTNNESISNIKNKINEIKLDIYQQNDSIYSISSKEVAFNIEPEETAKKVIEFGRNSNLFKNNIDILKAFFTKVNIEVSYKYDEAKLDEICKNIELTLKDRFVDDKYSIDQQVNKLIITRGTTGNTINISTEKDKIVECLKSNMLKSLNNEVSNTRVDLDLVKKEPISVNIDDIYKELKKEPKDAYIDKEVNPIKLVAEEVGYDINLEEVRTLISNEENKKEGKVIEIPITVLQPKVKLADITYTLYKDKLAGYTTYFDPSQSARANNLAIALRYLNGKIIMPGETFSYNLAIGDANYAKGYQAAATFKGGKVVQEVGGGICQTTSTLYNVALMANLEIVERHQHGLPVGYVPPSRDATVYSPSLDFKFKNTRKYPVKIVTSFSNSGSMNISLFGTREENEYEIILSHKYMSTVPFTTKYEYDDTMPEGTQVVISGGVNGYTSEGYITKKLNGVVTYSGLLSKDKYNPQQQIIRVGTKK